MEIKNILLTGEIKVGKSTIINKIIDKYFKYKVVAGFKTLPFFKNEKVAGYFIQDQLKKNQVANTRNIVGRISEKEQRYFGVNEVFEIEGVNILNKTLNSTVDLILIDELGFFENNAENFKSKIIDILENEKRVIGVLKKKNTKFLNSIKSRSDIIVIEVDRENRDYIEEKIKNYWKL